MLPPGYEPFLRAICTDPEDDTVRLVFADWLDENGDPERAEFIRLQVRRAQLKASGVEASWGPVKRPTYARAEIRDPDGNAIELRQWITPGNRARS